MISCYRSAVCARPVLCATSVFHSHPTYNCPLLRFTLATSDAANAASSKANTEVVIVRCWLNSLLQNGVRNACGTGVLPVPRLAVDRAAFLSDDVENNLGTTINCEIEDFVVNHRHKLRVYDNPTVSTTGVK